MLVTAARVRCLLKDAVRRVQSAGGSLLGPGALAVLDQAIVSGTSFATLLFLGRACTAAEVGAYHLAMSIALFARAMQEAVILAPYTVYCTRESADENTSYTGSTLVHQLLLSIGAAICLLLLAGALEFSEGPLAMSGTLGALAVMTPWFLVRFYIRHLCFSHLKFTDAIAVDSAAAGLQLGALLILVSLGNLSAPAVLWATAAATASVSVCWWMTSGRMIRVRAANIIPDWRKNWTFSRWVVASQLTHSASLLGLPWLLVIWHGAEAAGVLAIGTSIVGLANTVVMGLNNAICPQVAHAYARGGLAEMHRMQLKAATLVGSGVGVFCLTMYVAGDACAVLLYGAAYQGLGMLVFLLSLTLFVNSLSIIVGDGLWALDRPSANFPADVSSLVMTATTAAIAVPSLGALGVALSFLVGVVAGIIVRFLMLCRLVAVVRLETIA